MTFDEVLQKMAATHKSKNADYGNSFELAATLLGRPTVEVLLSRICDKVSRACNLVKSGRPMVTDESLADSLLDLSVYSILAILSLEKDDGHGAD
jgi:hypothetical protein